MSNGNEQRHGGFPAGRVGTGGRLVAEYCPCEGDGGPDDDAQAVGVNPDFRIIFKAEMGSGGTCQTKEESKD